MCCACELCEYSAYVMCFSDLFVCVCVFVQCVRVKFVYRIFVCSVRSVSMFVACLYVVCAWFMSFMCGCLACVRCVFCS